MHLTNLQPTHYASRSHSKSSLPLKPKFTSSPTQTFDRVLTLDSEPLPSSEHRALLSPGLNSAFPDEARYKFLETYDLETERLLDKFEDIIKFYGSDGSVLIHCVQGQSRSVCACAAIVMYEQKLTYEEAMEFMGSMGILTSNMIEAFGKQLQLFERMEYKVEQNTGNPEYRIWRFSMLNIESSSSSIRDVLWSSMSDKTDGKVIYRCSKCRRVLFKKSHLVSTNSSNYYLQPVDWMKSAIVDNGVNGKLECPKCQQKLGHFNWYGEATNDKKEWIVPVFNVSSKKVDKMSL